MDFHSTIRPYTLLKKSITRESLYDLPRKGLNLTRQQTQTRQEAIDFLLHNKLVVPHTTIYAISRLYTGKTRYVSFLLLRPRDITESIPQIRPFYLNKYIADILPCRLYEKRGYMCIRSTYSGDIAQDITEKLSYRLFNDKYKLQTMLETAWL